MSIFWTYLYSIYKLTYILCSYILGISGYHMFWYCDLLRRRTHCQSPKFLKSTVLEHDMAGWCSSWQTDWISRHPRTCDNVFSQRQAKHGWNEWWNLKGEIIGSTRRMTKSQCQKVTEKAKSRDENLNPRPRKRTSGQTIACADLSVGWFRFWKVRGLCRFRVYLWGRWCGLQEGESCGRIASR